MIELSVAPEKRGYGKLHRTFRQRDFAGTVQPGTSLVVTDRKIVMSAWQRRCRRIQNYRLLP